MPTATELTLTGRKPSTSSPFAFVRFSIPTVSASTTSAYYYVELPAFGYIDAVRVLSAGTSTDYDLYLGSVDNFTVDTMNNFLSLAGLDAGGYNETDLKIYYCNQDTAVSDKVYLKVTNSDAVNATGIISVEFVLYSLYYD